MFKPRNKYCYSCENATERCFRNEIGCPCEKYKSYKDENIKLKEENKFLKEQCLILADGNVCNSTCSEIKKQLTKTKEILEQLIKAKDIIKDFILMSRVEHLKDRYKTVDEAEQFLREAENKENEN